jgi:hypothetical protein
VDDRNESAHPNGNIFYSTETALDAKVNEILRVVAEIQRHSRPMIEHCYRDFLIKITTRTNANIPIPKTRSEKS